MFKKLGNLQKIGKALLMPIAVLPAAALLLRLGAPDVVEMLNINSIQGPEGEILLVLFSIMNTSGKIIFDNLPILFAVGIAIGLAENSGVAALAAVIGYFVLIQVLTSMTPFVVKLKMLDVSAKIDMGVFSGILIGILVAYLYNRYKDIKLPDYLQFFGGRRFIPIITAFTTVLLGIALSFIWPPVQKAIALGGNWIISSGAIGIFTYGVLNRLLLPFGLHHILNSIVWFMLGSFQTPGGEIVHGDLYRFFAGDKTAGVFMAGFYPVMLFGLPAACLAMIHTALPARKKIITGLLLSAALTSFLTGVTEPIEFSFMFLAPLLYLVHAVLTGLALVIANSLGIKQGFGFSAGLIDYILSWGIAAKPYLLIPVGIAYSFLYYILFTAIIKLFNLPTPGRELEKEKDKIEETGKKQTQASTSIKEKAISLTNALGGKENILSIDSCITRLRLKLKNEAVVDERLLKTLGAHGTVRFGDGLVQVVLGTQAELICEQMKLLKPSISIIAPLTGRVIMLDKVPDQVFSEKMMGDGAAIEAEENTAVAPVSGKLVVLFPGGHAFGIRTKEGIEVLVHIGLNTVELGGEGFIIHKKQDDMVMAGELIVTFDPVLCKKKQKSLISPVIITNMEKISSIQPAELAKVKAGNDILFEAEM